MSEPDMTKFDQQFDNFMEGSPPFVDGGFYGGPGGTLGSTRPGKEPYEVKKSG